MIRKTSFELRRRAIIWALALADVVEDILFLATLTLWQPSYTLKLWAGAIERGWLHRGFYVRSR